MWKEYPTYDKTLINIFTHLSQRRHTGTLRWRNVNDDMVQMPQHAQYFIIDKEQITVLIGLICERFNRPI